MKTKNYVWILFLGFGLLSACYVTESSTRNVDDQEPAYRELADLIRKQPGVDVRGQSPNYDITIRGKGTFITSHQPIYVVDGLILGDRYADIVNSINIVDVDHIRVIKGADASAYGSRGANGVIEIHLRKG